MRHLRDEHSAGAVDWLTSFEGEPLLLPQGFTPDAELLARHATAAAASATGG